MGFIFWLFLAGILIAGIQDLRRREVDNWLCLFLIFSSLGFIFMKSIFNLDYSFIFLAVFSMITMFIISNIFYYSRIFAGGDSKLLFAMFGFFVGSSFSFTLINIGIFVLLLLFSGALWGLFYSLGLFFINYKKSAKAFKEEFRNIYLRYFIFAGVVLFVLSFVNILFLFPSIFVFLSGLMFALGKSIEKTALTKEISVDKLREGDLLVNDVKVKGKTIKADWEGLGEKDLSLLKKLKRKVKIKEGIPFVPGFFIAVIIYFFREQIIGFLF